MVDWELIFGDLELGDLDGVIWWAGWHPRQLSWVGAALGLLAGTALGVLDGGALAIGLVLLGLGVKYDRFYLFEGLLAFIVAVTVYLVGPDATLDAARGAGLDLGGLLGFLGDVADGVLEALALLGLALDVAEPVTVAFGRLYQVVSLGLAGAAVVLPLWVVGLVHATSTYDELYREYADRIEGKGKQMLGPDEHWDRARFYNLTYGIESVPLLKPNKEYYVTNLYIGDHAIGVHADSRIDMVQRDVEVSTSTRELFYDQVASVDYTDPYLEVKMSDGEKFRFISTTEPGELLDDVKTSLQQYKSL
jgi:hypothetical protein